LPPRPDVGGPAAPDLPLQPRREGERGGVAPPARDVLVGGWVPRQAGRGGAGGTPEGEGAARRARLSAGGRAAASVPAIRRSRPVHVLRLQRDLALALPRGRAALQSILDSDGALSGPQPAGPGGVAPGPADAVPPRRADQDDGPFPRRRGAAGPGNG